MNLTIDGSNVASSPALELDYDKLADKIADRMETNKSFPSEQNDIDIDNETDPKIEGANMTESMDTEALEKEDVDDAKQEIDEALVNISITSIALSPLAKLMGVPSRQLIKYFNSSVRGSLNLYLILLS